MADQLQVFPIGRPPGYIDQSVAHPEPNQFYQLINTDHRRGRIAPRGAVDRLGSSGFEDDQGAPAEVTGICGIEDHASRMYVVTHSSNTDKVYLHSANYVGTDKKLEGVVWTSVPVQPRVTLASFEGGTAGGGTKRLYIADYDQNQVTRFWDGDDFNDVSVDLDNDNRDEDVKFSIVHAFNFHVWGVGWFENTPRPEMVRFSQPGAIPGTDPAGGNNPKEWFSADHRSVGARGDEIRAVASAGERLLVFQKDTTHVIFGTGGDNYTRQTVSENVGCVGPYAAVSDGRGRVFFWSNEGPYVTDGKQVKYLGRGIERAIQNAGGTEQDYQVGYSPRDGLVFFVTDNTSVNTFDLGMKFVMKYDVDMNRWVSFESWMPGDTGTEDISVQGMTVAPSQNVIGPSGAPSSLSATAGTGDEPDVNLSWTNNDTTTGVKTEIHRSTSSGFSLSSSTLVAKVGAGVSSYTDTSTDHSTTYYYKIRYIKNGQISSSSSEASATTNFPGPHNLDDRAITGGHQITWDNFGPIDNRTTEIERCKGSSCSDFSKVGESTVVGGSDSFDDTDVIIGDDYTYRLRYVDGSDVSSYSSEITVTAGVATEDPEDPTGLSIDKDSNGNPKLSWTDNADNETGYEIHRDTSSGFSTSLQVTIGPDNEEYIDENASTGTQYYYKVRAKNDNGTSGFTTEATITAGLPPDTPQNFSVDNVNDSTNEVDLSWDDVSSETSFEVFRDGALITTLSADTTTYTDVAPDDNTSYEYKVRACNGAGCSDFSNTDTANLGPNF